MQKEEIDKIAEDVVSTLKAGIETDTPQSHEAWLLRETKKLMEDRISFEIKKVALRKEISKNAAVKMS